MRVLVAGATSVPGIPLLRELNARGHEVVGLTRSSDKTPAIEAAGAKPVVADVFDTVQLDAVLGELASRGGRQPADHTAQVGTEAVQGL